MSVVPDLKFEIDFTNDASNPTRAYTDVTADVREIGWVRGGRNNELQRTEAGTLDALLNNRAGKYDSTNTASPYYPGVKRMRWCRASGTWAGVTYKRWTGLIETWKQEWPAYGTDAVVTVSAVDAFKVLNLFDLNGLSYGAQLPGDRVASVCASVGLPSSIEAGADLLPAVGPFAEGSMALPHLLAVEENENGLMFVAADGTVTFQSRYYRMLNSSTPLGVIGDTFGTIPYRTGELDLDDADIYNIAVVTPDGGTPETSSDATSIATHFKRPLNRSMLSTSQALAQSAAQFLVGLYADPDPRIPMVELVGANDPSKWPAILSADNSDRFTWKRTGMAHTIQQDVFVERIAESVRPNMQWDVTLQLSPASDRVGWVAQDAVYGLAGVTTVGVY